jgi:hypothetical protein
VNTGIVGGVELATPNGLTSEEEALKVTLEEVRILHSMVSALYTAYGTHYPDRYFKSRNFRPLNIM